MLLIFTIEFPNSTLNVNPSNPLKPKYLCTNVFVEASFHNA
uniref:Uncharacterized protein n=1 Tax=Medicago truncatula TaxID=3880 RepID=I3S329_MEDTR|nr:unknown [Medicago truncatula]